MTPEGELKNKIKLVLADLGPSCWWFMPVSFGYGPRGIPDFVGCLKGHFFGIEAKRRGEKARVWQLHQAAGIAAARGTAWLVDTPERVEEFKRWAYAL